MRSKVYMHPEPFMFLALTPKIGSWAVELIPTTHQEVRPIALSESLGPQVANVMITMVQLVTPSVAKSGKSCQNWESGLVLSQITDQNMSKTLLLFCFCSK